MTTIDRIAAGLKAVRKQRPVIHNITNYVAMSSSANALLALGASPLMAHAPEEMEEVVALAGAVVLNIGTLSAPWVDSMLLAGRAARARGVPVVLDPAGAGATTFRTLTARRLIAEACPAVIRGNASEIMALDDDAAKAHGVDSRNTVEEAREAAIRLARRHGTVVAATGPEDFVTDGRRVTRIRNGHPLMARITASGCAASATVGALCAVEDDHFMAAVAGLMIFGIAGELAAANDPHAGTYQGLLIDALEAIDESALRRGARFDESTCDQP